MELSEAHVQSLRIRQQRRGIVDTLDKVGSKPLSLEILG